MRNKINKSGVLYTKSLVMKNLLALVVCLVLFSCQKESESDKVFGISLPESKFKDEVSADATEQAASTQRSYLVEPAAEPVIEQTIIRVATLRFQ